MYNILILISQRNDYKSLYQFYREEKDGQIELYSTDSDVILKEKLRELLKDYTKEEILVINNLDWDVLVGINGEIIETIEITTEDIDAVYTEVENEVFGNE